MDHVHTPKGLIVFNEITSLKQSQCGRFVAESDCRVQTCQMNHTKGGSEPVTLKWTKPHRCGNGLKLLKVRCWAEFTIKIMKILLEVLKCADTDMLCVLC